MEVTEKLGTLTIMWELNNKLLNGQCVNEEIARKIRKYSELSKETSRMNGRANAGLRCGSAAATTATWKVTQISEQQGGLPP